MKEESDTSWATEKEQRKSFSCEKVKGDGCLAAGNEQQAEPLGEEEAELRGVLAIPAADTVPFRQWCSEWAGFLANRSLGAEGSEAKSADERARAE